MAIKRVTSKKRQAAKLKVEYVDITSLKPWSKNPRKNDEAVESVVRSIEKFGYTNPILVRRADRRIIAGHTRLKALKEIGEKKVPVIFLDIGKTDAEMYALYDNKSVENTPWDIPKLNEVFADLTKIDTDISLTGFTFDEIGALSTENKKSDKQHIMTFEVTVRQRELIKAALADQNGDTRTERLLAALDIKPQRAQSKMPKVMSQKK